MIPRIGNNYNDTNESIGSIQSATTIRTLLRDGKSIKNYISPTDVFEYINVDQKLLYKIFLTNLDIVRDKKMKIFLSEGGQLISKINKIITKNTFSNIDFSDYE